MLYPDIREFFSDKTYSKMQMRFSFLKLILLLLFVGCKSPRIQEEKPESYRPVEISTETLNDTLRLSLTNKIMSPVQIRVKSSDSIFSKKSDVLSFVLKAKQDTLLQIALGGKETPELNFQAGLGDPKKKIIYKDVGLPIPKNKAVRIIQGHKGAYSHHSEESKFAIDFDLKVGDTVFAAFEGYVIQATEGNKSGGKDLKWLEFANKIVVYNPDAGLFFLYSHLDTNGALVEQGNWVRQGEPIGLSGMTGYTDIPHLHFNVLVPHSVETRLISMPVDFVEGYRGKDLQRNNFIKRE